MKVPTILLAYSSLKNGADVGASLADCCSLVVLCLRFLLVHSTIFLKLNGDSIDVGTQQLRPVLVQEPLFPLTSIAPPVCVRVSAVCYLPAGKV